MENELISNLTEEEVIILINNVNEGSKKTSNRDKGWEVS
jgi:hypothetical protein